MLVKFNEFIHFERIQDSLRACAAVLVALLFSHLAKFQFPYWITMTTILMLQSNFGASLAQSYTRTIGTIVGLLFGVMLFMLFHQNILLIYFSFPVLVFLFVYLFSISALWGIFILSMLIGILFSYMYPDPWNFVFWRISDTILGAGISLCALFLIFPKLAKKELGESLKESIKLCQKLFCDVLNNINTPPTQKIDRSIVKQIIKIEKLLSNKRMQFLNYSYEPLAVLHSKNIMYDIILAQERIHSIILSLITIYNYKDFTITEELKYSLTEFIEKSNFLIENLSYAIDNKTELPSLEILNEQLQKIKNTICYGNQTPEPQILLYRNLVSYKIEIKHIILGLQQLRKHVNFNSH